MREVNESIFKAYDIRGRYPSEINEDTAYSIGQAFGTFLFQNEPAFESEVVLGSDVRISSPALRNSAAMGLRDTGIDVLDIGPVTVDAVYFASAFWHRPALMVTASHNPKDWNGFKLMMKDAGFLGSDFGLGELKALIKRGDFLKAEKKGVEEKRSIVSEYLEHLLGFLDVSRVRPMRVAIDSGSGSCGVFLERLLDKLPLEVRKLNFAPDGNFPSHDPNPTREENLLELKGVLAEGHFSFGVAFDGDGDRIVFLDEDGEFVSPSIIGAILARFLLLRNGAGAIVYSVASGRIIPEVVKAYNGLAYEERVGHNFISKKLRQLGGILGIEASGHYFFRNNFFFDSGLASFLVALEAFSGQKKSLGALRREFSKYFSFQTDFPLRSPEKLIDLAANYFSGFEVKRIDGLSVATPDFWFNLRASNTEPLARLTLEAKEELVLVRAKHELMDLIAKIIKENSEI